MTDLTLLPLPADKPQTTICCHKCGQLLLDNLQERAISELYEASKAHSCPPQLEEQQ